jgi:hypothetical protein
VDVLFVVELGDLGFFVDLCELVLIVFHAIDFLEEFELELTLLRLGLFRSLHHVEGKGKELLAVSNVQVVAVNVVFVIIEGLLELGNTLLVSLRNSLGDLDVVDSGLEGNRVAVASLNFLFSEVADVFETVNLTIHPEHLVLVFTQTLNLVLGGHLGNA